MSSKSLSSSSKTACTAVILLSITYRGLGIRASVEKLKRRRRQACGRGQVFFKHGRRAHAMEPGHGGNNSPGNLATMLSPLVQSLRHTGVSQDRAFGAVLVSHPVPASRGPHALMLLHVAGVQRSRWSERHRNDFIAASRDKRTSSKRLLHLMLHLIMHTKLFVSPL